MANVRGTRGIEGRTRSRNPVVEEIVPSSGWTEDASGHYLLVDLPDFKKDEVKLQVDSSGNMTISGERQVNEDKYIYFEQTFKVPENLDIDKTTGKFDGEILYVTVPKQVVEEKTDHERVKENANGSAREKRTNNENVKRDGHQHGNIHGNHRVEEQKIKGNAHIGFSEETIRKWENESVTNLGNVVKMLKRNKGIVITAVLAFSLGVLVTHKLESTGH